MLIDHYWKSELKRLCYEIKIWENSLVFYKYTEYRLSRALLYSAIILRKMFEDESEVKEIAKKVKRQPPKLTVINSTINAIRYSYIAEDEWAVRGKLCAADYGKGTDASLKTKDVCNWLIHSYVWGVAHYTNERKYAGFLVASDLDKGKFVHFISFDDWVKMLKYVLEDAVF